MTPNQSPAAAAATSPEKPSAFEITTEPKRTATESAVSENGSSNSLCKSCEPAARPIPIAIPPKNTHAKCPIVSKMLTLISVVLSGENNDPCEAAIAMIEENMITPAASLKLASDSINVASVFGIFTLLKTSITIAASVGAINAAKAKATSVGSPAKYDNNSPPTLVASQTPTVASTRDDILIILNCSRSIFIIASKIRGGMTK